MGKNNFEKTSGQKLLIDCIAADDFSIKVAQKVFDFIKEFVEKPVQKEKYLTSKEAANQLQINPVTLNSYCKQGIIKSYRFGSSVRFKQSEIEDMVTSGCRNYKR